MDPNKFEKVEICTSQQLWDWLDANHEQDESIWVVTWKAAHRDKYVSRTLVLDALIAYGWVDGRRLKLDDDRTMQLLSKRKQQAWAKSYQDRAAALIKDGRMQEPGLRAIADSKAGGKWNEMASVDALSEPDDFVAELVLKRAKAWWDQSAPSYRRNVLRWIASAKKLETRAKRIGIVADFAAKGEKVPQY